MHLRSDIFAGRLVPGQRLKFPELSQRYDCSIGAAREALTKLVAEGLVTTQPHQGYAVTKLSYEDLFDLTRARMETEPLVFKMSVESGDVQWESDVLAAHHILQRAPYFDKDDSARLSDEWVSAHGAFHTALLSGCRNKRLFAIVSSLRQEAELYRQWSVLFEQDSSARRDVAGEHEGLLEAALAREPELAQARLREHIAHTASLLLRDPQGQTVPQEAQLQL